VQRLLAILTVAAIGCSGDADFSGTIDTVTLNADEYQADILALDRLIFTEKPLGEEGVRDLSERLKRLSQRVKGTSDSKFLTLESLELRRLAEQAGRLSPSGPGGSLRNDWMRLRNNLFDDRSWFVRSAADLDYAAQYELSQQPVPPPRIIHERPPAMAIAPALYETATRSSLIGAWRVTNVYGNGEERNDPEISDSIWTFDSPRLSVLDPNGKKTEYIYTLVRDSTGDAIRIQQPIEQAGWMNYQLDGDGLKIAFYDNLRGRPDSFAQRPGQTEPLLVVLRLRPVS
jgi:uncharacterized protein (TIGR03067 family)